MKTALVTGASGGIGKAIVKEFISNGYFVVAQYNKNYKGIQELIEELPENQREYLFAISADFNVKGEAQKLFDKVRESFKHIDVLVLNAGKDLYKLYTDTTEEEWDSLFNVNVKANFMLSKLFLPEMISRQSGNIVFVSSIWGNNGASMEVGYSATKASLIGLTKSLAKEVSYSKINVNCVCPGVVDTPMNSRFTQEEMNEIISSTPMGRTCSPQEVASLIYYLTTETAKFITGQTITIDGGFTL